MLAGLIILGTLLASVATARGRFLRQWGQADRRLQVIQATDNLINSWMSIQPSSAGTCAVPASGSGSLPGATGCSWRTRLVRSSAARPLAAVVVRLEVFDRPGYAAEPLLAIELLAHDPGRRPSTTAPVASPRGPVAHFTGSGEMKGHLSNGFTLLELLVASVLASVLMMAVLAVLGAVRHHRRLLDVESRTPRHDPLLRLLRRDLENARTMATPLARGDGGVILVGNGGIRPRRQSFDRQACPRYLPHPFPSPPCWSRR